MGRILSNLTKWYFSRRAIPYWSVILADSLIVLASTIIVFVLSLGLLETFGQGGRLWAMLAIYWVAFAVGFRAFRTYSGVVRYSTFVDMQRLAMAVTLSTVILIPLQVFVLDNIINLNIPSVLAVSMLSMLLLWAERVWVKYLFDATTKKPSTENVFIYGVKHGGLSLAKSLDTQASPFSVVGFVSDNENLEHKQLLGVDVYNNDEHLVDHMKEMSASVLLVSPLKNECIRDNDDMVNRLIEAGVKIYMTPPAMEWDGKSDLNYANLHKVDAEDLLPRDKIEIDMDAVGQLLTGRVILITGAAGSIGSEMVRQIAGFNPERLVLIDQAETPLHDIRLMMRERWPHIEAHTIIADISNRQRIDEIFAQYHPDYVFHAAAYKHVPMMEDNPVESIINNVEGTRVVADAAVRYETKKFVMISTDKAVNPTNVMGASKRICEIYVQSLDSAIKQGTVRGVTRFVTTRFGNVLGSNGSVIPLFTRQIAAGGPVTVTHPDIIRYFMLIPEACKLVLEAGTMGKGGEIFVFDMGKPVRIADLARRMIKLSGAANIEIKYTGLRDGEKLYEELLNDQEATMPTFHPKIKIARVREYDYAETSVTIGALVNAAVDCRPDMEIVAAMKHLVPEYISRHSIYEQLDRSPR
jgi:FlaA1/EpsC-like NDP-sugar epimerase